MAKAKKTVKKKRKTGKTGPRKAATKKATPRKAATKKATPRKAATKKATPRKAAAKKATRRKAAAKRATPRKAAAKRATPRKAAVKKAAPKKVAIKKTRFSRATLAQYRATLLEKKKRIQGNYESLRNTHLRSSQRDSTGDLSGYSMHMADVGTDTYEREFGLSVVSSEGDRLYNINQALQRIEAKTYGRCEGCGSHIKVTRLKAVPWARLCIGCKKELEKKKGKGF